jgi:hypothetical protein
VPGYAGFSDRTGLYRHQDTQSFQTSYALQALPGIYRGKDMEKLFKTRFTTAVIVLIPACIGINYLGKLFAAALKLPLWLDCIGTCIGAVLGGPIIAGICGAANNLIYGLTTGDNITLIYALTSFGIGVGVGIMGRLGFMKSVGGAILTAVVEVLRLYSFPHR